MAVNEENSSFGTSKFSLIERFKTFLNKSNETKGLNVFFASLCVIDLFGVFPIVVLPPAIISCGKYDIKCCFSGLLADILCLPGFYGIPLLFFVVILQIYTAVILGKCWLVAERLDPNIKTKSR